MDAQEISQGWSHVFFPSFFYSIQSLYYFLIDISSLTTSTKEYKKQI